MNLNEIGFSELMSNAYLDGFVQELLRHLPPATGMRRLLTRSHRFSNGVQLPAGITLHVPIGASTMSEDLYPNAEQFDPRRYLINGANSNMSKYLNMPFGLGIRTCPGVNVAELELKFFALALIDQDYHQLKYEIDPTRLTYARTTPVRCIDVYLRFFSPT
jgi:cytochrome P450